MEDSEIIALLKNDPGRGLCEAVRKYRPYAAAIVGRVLGDSERDAEECVADAFVAVWKTAQGERGLRSLKGCIAFAARNTAINRYRKLHREHMVDIDEIELPSGEDITLDFESGADVITVQELINGMDEPDREIFVRKYYLMESVREIARRTSLQEIQVKNRLYRGRQRLKKQLEERDVTA